MKAFVCVHLCALLLVSTAFRPRQASMPVSQPKPGKTMPAGKENDVRWDRTEHDFGTIKQGQVVETSFTCYNGDDTLQLENVLASCGCVVPDWKRTPILPHDSTILRIVFDTKGKSGKHTKVVTVYSNKGLYELVVTANIKN